MVEGMTNSVLDELAAISREILAPGRELIELLPQALALRDLFERLARFRIDTGRDIGAGETRLDSGLAISPTLAAMCIREPFRTLAFIRGLAGAIGDALHADRPVRVLYAGCGPYALLALPLMTAYSPAQARFTLLDIHQDALAGALALIDTFGLAGHLDGAFCADATRYEIPADALPDVIVSETVAVCLHNEPQVSIARHLLSQAPGARMVPRSVRVDACMLDVGREHLLLPADHAGGFPAPQRDRLPLGTLFELDAAAVHGWHGLEGDRLPAGRVRIPARLDARYRFHLLTRIDVHGENTLQDYDSSLTVPQPLPGRPSFEGGENLQFHYRLGSRPELGYEVLE